MRRLAALVVFAIMGCASLTSTDRSELAVYAAQQDACIAANPGNRAAIDSCRAAAKKDWCARWAARFDAGICD